MPSFKTYNVFISLIAVASAGALLPGKIRHSSDSKTIAPTSTIIPKFNAPILPTLVVPTSSKPAATATAGKFRDPAASAPPAKPTASVKSGFATITAAKPSSVKTTTASTSIPQPTAAAASTSDRETSDSTLCPKKNGADVPDSSSSYWYNLRCGIAQNPDQWIDQTTQPSLDACMKRCSSWNDQHSQIPGESCYGVSYFKSTQVCGLYFFAASSSPDPNVDTAIILTD